MSWLDTVISWFASKDPVALASSRAADEAERYFTLDIVDPPKGSSHPQAARWLKVISEIIHRCGWTWIKYEGNEKGANQWCGEFAGACYAEAGLDPQWLRDFFPSTYRLLCWARGRPAPSGKGAGGPRPLVPVTSRIVRFADGTPPRRGDILLVGTGHDPNGNHVTLVLSYDEKTGVFKTISGNGGGLGPDGKHREGVVKADFSVGATKGYHPMWVIRVLESDLLLSKK